MADTQHQRYRVTEKIDAGGMAEVYRGIAESAVGGIKKAVAIKRILPNLTKNKKFIAMFLDEARVSMHLQHANIVGVFDIGISDTTYFIVMEYVEGANLKTIIDSMRRQNRRVPVEQVLYLMMEVCKGLQYAHDVSDPETGRELGIVHRDISPPNILISKRGEVKLVDFGLAKATSQLESTDPGTVKGKFSYLAPEAAEGVEVDRRTDIFAVGILLYEMLTGKRLFLGETDYQTVELVRQARVPPLAAQNADVLPELERIVRKALARDVQSRFQTAGDLQDALAQYLFSQRLKVTSRDIEGLVADCLREKRRTQPNVQAAPNLIDTLISEEMGKFTSLDNLNEAEAGGGGGGGALSPSPADDRAAAPLDPGLFVDPRGWASDFSSAPGTGSRNGAAGRAKHNTGEIQNLEDILEGQDSRARSTAPSTGRAAAPPQRGSSAKHSAAASSSSSDVDATVPPAANNMKRNLTIAAMGVVLVLAGLAAYFLSDLLLPTHGP